MKHPDLATVCFTGSRAVGMELVKQAAINSGGKTGIKRVIAELGGKNAIIVDDDADINPKYGKAKKFCEKLAAEGVLCKDTRDQTIRFTPPLIVTKAELDWALERIRKIFLS
jgi:acyl-CoA reductase-like NAD-dependent aldehyde dehydrogenase